MDRIVYSEEEKKTICSKIYDLILEGKTIRQIAKELDRSKSSIHYYIHHWFIGGEYQIICDILDHNFSDKCRRGGQAKRNRWKLKRGLVI